MVNIFIYKEEYYFYKKDLFKNKSLKSKHIYIFVTCTY